MFPGDGWCKHFKDGSSAVGLDLDVNKSWRRSRNDGIIAVDLFHNNQTLRIEGKGEYWQSDDFESVFQLGTQPAKVVRRRIMKQIGDSTQFHIVSPSKDITIISFGNRIDHFPKETILLDSSWWPSDTWLILELDVLTNKVSWYQHRDKK